MRTVFFGTPEFACVSLAAVHAVPLGPALEPIVPAAPDHPVVAAEAVDNVFAGRAVENVRAARALAHAAVAVAVHGERAPGGEQRRGEREQGDHGDPSHL